MVLAVDNFFVSYFEFERTDDIFGRSSDKDGIVAVMNIERKVNTVIEECFFGNYDLGVFGRTFFDIDLYALSSFIGLTTSQFLPERYI